MSKHPVSRIVVEHPETQLEPMTQLPLKLQQFKSQLEKQAMNIDKVILGKSLIEEIHPIISTSEKCANDVYAWDFKSGEKAIESRVSKEMNIFFLGTGSMPYFGEHQVISEGGDVLCHLALQKGAYEKQPSMIVKGVGTVVLKKECSKESGNDAYYPLDSLINKNTKFSGNVIETVFGNGIGERVTTAMEDFYIPNLMKMIINNKVGDHDYVTYDINVVGHSRGAITGFHMITCIDQWLNNIKNRENKIDYQEIANLCHIPKSQIMKAMRLIQNGNVDCRVNSLSFDPVEGKCRSSDSVEWFSNDTTIPVSIKGLNNPLRTNCSSMPSIVKKAEIYLAESERRNDFRPTLPEFCSQTNVSYKVQMGTHSTMTGNIGNDDGAGQDAYKSVKKFRFVKEAALASIDKVKLDATQFLFPDKLPPFQRHMLRRIFGTQCSDYRYAYQSTINYFNKKFNDHFHNNSDFNAFLAKHVKVEGEGEVDNTALLNLLSQNADLRISCAEWLMQQDSQIASHAYFLLNKDIHDQYLHPTDLKKKNELKMWQDEMKRDTTSVILGPITGFRYYSLGMQEPEQSREIFIRKDSNKLDKHSLSAQFKEFHASNNSYYNPYHVVLSESLHVDRKKYNESILDLDLSFAKLNEILVRRKQHTHFHATQLQNELALPIQQFLENLEKCHFSRSQHINALAALFQKIDQFHESRFNEISGLIYNQLTSHHNRMIFNKSKAIFLNEKIVNEAKQHLAHIKNKMANFLKDFQSEYAQAKINSLLNKLNDYCEDLNNNNLSSKVNELKSEMREILQLELKVYSFKNRLYNFIFGIKAIDPNMIFADIMDHLKLVAIARKAYLQPREQLKDNSNKTNSLSCLWGLNLYRNNLMPKVEAANDVYKTSPKMVTNMS